MLLKFECVFNRMQVEHNCKHNCKRSSTSNLVSHVVVL